MPQSPLAASIGVNAKGATKSQQVAQFGQQGELFMAQRHAVNYEPNYAGNMYFASNQAGTTTSAGLATTYTGLCVSNPAGSGKNLVIVRATGALIVAPSTITTGLLIVGGSAGGVTVHTTPLTVFSATLGASAAGAVGLADAACTLVGTPAYARVFAQSVSATSAWAYSSDLDGSILVPPGYYAALGTNIASPASGFIGSILWEEVPL